MIVQCSRASNERTNDKTYALTGSPLTGGSTITGTFPEVKTSVFPSRETKPIDLLDETDALAAVTTGVIAQALFRVRRWIAAGNS